MSFSFKTILVPVDFSINTEVAINKAVEVADKDGANIHLLHIREGNRQLVPLLEKNGKALSKSDLISTEEMMEQWMVSIGEQAPHIMTTCSFSQNINVQRCIAEKIVEIKADLVVIGKKTAHTWYSFRNTVIPNELATESGCAVLTVRPGSMHRKIKTLVVPITSEVSQQKMETIGALCNKKRVKVHLVTYAETGNDGIKNTATTLLKVYQWLKDSLHCAVEYAVLKGNNRARATMEYAEKIEADILLVNSGTETKIGWMNQDIANVLPAHSKVQVLAVHQIR